MTFYGLGNLSKKRLAAGFAGLIIFGFVLHFYLVSTPLKHDKKKRDLSSDLDHKFMPLNNLLSDMDEKFMPLNHGTDIRTFAGVCLQKKLVASPAQVDKNSSASEIRIVIYDSTKNDDTKLRIAMSPTCGGDPTWPVSFRKGNVPSHLPMMPFPAYFVRASSPGNLFHLMQDILRGLYGVLRDTNRLNSTVKNQVYTREVFIDERSNKFISRYGDLIRALGVRSFPSYRAVSPVCYPYGVFGWRPVNMQEVARYYVKSFNYNDNECPKGPVVTFIERQYRKVTNMDTLIDVAKKLGTKTRRTFLERLSLYDQYVTIRCTDVLVGVQGAGLQWAMLMRPNRALIELYYPGWQPIFSTLHLRDFKQLKAYKVLGKKEGAQWDFLQYLFDKKEPFTEEEKKRYNSAKFMDSNYNTNDFQKVLQKVLTTIKI